jgi:hypothetical protein
MMMTMMIPTLMMTPHRHLSKHTQTRRVSSTTTTKTFSEKKGLYI